MAVPSINGSGDNSGPSFRILDGGVAFVTGAASGIGAATAAKFASLGASALVLCDINLAAQTAQAEKLGLQYPNVEILPLQIDTRDEDSIVRAHQMAVNRFGRIDYAVNNAGIPGVMKATPEMTVDEFGLAMNTNLTGVWICQREQITQMLKQEPLRGSDRGTIVNLSSVYGILCGQFTTSYGASKHAVLGITRNDACNYAKSGIRINAVCPGFIQTPILDHPNASLGVQSYLATVPMGRMGKPSEIADAVIFLSSTMSQYVTGTQIVVDGGFTCV